MRRKFLSWDHDGVLVDTERWYFAATREGLAGLGIDLGQDTYLEFMAVGRSCWELAARAGVADARVAGAKRARDARYRHLIQHQDIALPGVIETLECLRGRYRMAIVSTAHRADIELIHRDRRILDFFELVIAFEDCARAKPDPEPYLQALRGFCADNPGEAIAIEDSSRGLASAVAAGIDCVVVRNAFTAAQGLLAGVEDRGFHPRLTRRDDRRRFDEMIS
jgi:HAD superfamily hydrolase (TIGR01509 family)